MNKVKLALTLLSIAIVVIPLAGAMLIYRNNLVGLVVPPELKNLGTNVSNDNSTGLPLQLPTLAEEPQYNQKTGAFSYPINFTNPLNSEISVDQMSAEIKFKDNNAILGNISITKPIQIAPGETGLINATGTLDPQKVSQIQAQYSEDINNIVLENVNIVVSGVNMHFDEIDAGSLQGIGL